MGWIDITDELKVAPTVRDLYTIVCKYWDDSKPYPLFKIDKCGRIFRRTYG